MPTSFRLRHHPSAVLLGAQLLALVLFPIMDDSGTGRVLYAAVGAVVVALALWVVNRSPAVNWIAWAFAAPAITLTLAALFLGRSDLLVWSSIFESLLYFYSAGALIAYMLKDHEVTGARRSRAGPPFTRPAGGSA